MRELLDHAFYQRDSQTVAVDLLNKVVVYGAMSARIVEVEAYGGSDDPASHAFRGLTPRNAVMFGPPGRLYVYFTYGMHFCCNVVCDEDGRASAVLLRAAAPLTGIAIMRQRRRLSSEAPLRHLLSGPAKLCQAFAIDQTHNGADLVSGDHKIELFDDGFAPPDRPARGKRVGISRGEDFLWRWWVRGDSNVSRPNDEK